MGGPRRPGTRRSTPLLENALRYSPRGSRVEIATGPRRIAVLDRGPGIGADERELVFERFRRGRTGQSGPVRGNGLGLPIARELVREWGGELTLEPRPGGGTAAVISFNGGRRSVAVSGSRLCPRLTRRWLAWRPDETDATGNCLDHGRAARHRGDRGAHLVGEPSGRTADRTEFCAALGDQRARSRASDATYRRAHRRPRRPRRARRWLRRPRSSVGHQPLRRPRSSVGHQPRRPPPPRRRRPSAPHPCPQRPQLRPDPLGARMGVTGTERMLAPAAVATTERGPSRGRPPACGQG